MREQMRLFPADALDPNERRPEVAPLCGPGSVRHCSSNSYEVLLDEAMKITGTTLI
jgi:hypothetical protein